MRVKSLHLQIHHLLGNFGNQTFHFLSFHLAASHCFYFSPQTSHYPAETFIHTNMSVFPVGLPHRQTSILRLSVSAPGLSWGWTCLVSLVSAPHVPESSGTLCRCWVSSCGDPEFCLFSLMSNAFFSLAHNFWSVLKMKTVSGVAALSQSFIYG